MRKMLVIMNAMVRDNRAFKAGEDRDVVTSQATR